MSNGIQPGKCVVKHRHPVPRGLLMLAYWFPPVNESGALRPSRFCKYLPEFGYQPIVVAASNAGSLDALPNVMRTPGAHRRERAAIWLDWISRGLQRILPYNDRLEWVPHAVASAGKLFLTNDISVVVSTSPPIATHIAAFFLRRRFEVAWIADFRDPLVANPFRTRLHGRLYDALLERAILSQADAVIVNTDAALDALAKRHPKFRDKIYLIWNGYDAEDELIAAQIPPRPAKIIAHFGSIYGGRHPGRVIDSLVRLLQEEFIHSEKIHLRLIGSIDRDEPWISHCAFSDLVARGCLDYTERLLPRVEARRQMAEADYFLLLDLNELETGLQVPAKLFEYVQIGRPILSFTTKNSPVDRILKDAGTRHVCIYPEDSEAEGDRKVLALISMPTDPVKPSEWFRHRFEARKQTECLAFVIESAVTKRGIQESGS